MRLEFQGFARIHTVLERILVSDWRARPLCATMHPASLLAANRRRSTRRSFPGLCPATEALLHLDSVSLVHFSHSLRPFPRNLALRFCLGNG